MTEGRIFGLWILGIVWIPILVSLKYGPAGAFVATAAYIFLTVTILAIAMIVSSSRD